MSIPGSYANGFAPRDGQPLYSSLWRGCVGAWAPCLGPTGLTFRDWSGLGNNSTLANFTPASAWGPNGGRIALLFDGTDDYGSLSGDLVASNTRYTVSAWVNPASTASNATAFSVRSTTALSPILFQLNRSGANYAMIVRDDSGNVASATGGTVTANRWTHICGTRNGNTTALYVDGVLVATATASIGTITIDSANIGAVVAGAGATRSSFWNGYLDDLRCYNRELRPNEITLLASRRGVAFDIASRRRVRVAVFKAVWAARKAQIIGGGLN